jgi:hypothetical protein
MRQALLLLAAATGLAACLVAACGGAGSARDALYPSGYEGWQRLNQTPILKIEQAEIVNLYASPDAHADGGRMALGTVLVKEQRHLLGSEAHPQSGKVFLVSVMIKQPDGGWSYGAFEPETGAKAAKVDTDGCMLCHTSRRDTDSTYVAMQKLR